MSITKSYNKKTKTYYAYETTYEWSDEKQRKVQRKRCVGKFDPATGAIVPNGKVGRPCLHNPAETSAKEIRTAQDNQTSVSSHDSVKLAERLNRIEETLQILSAEIHDLSAELRTLSAESSGEC